MSSAVCVVAACAARLVNAAGGVLEQGTHSQLLAIPSGTYSNMWEERKEEHEFTHG